jgi:DNA-binding CsgD family transcriptional regulator
LLGLTDALGPLMGSGFGVAAWRFRVVDFESEVAVGVEREIAELMKRVGARAPQPIAAGFFLGARSTPASERVRLSTRLDEHPAFVELGRHGICDFNALTLVDASGVGLAFAAPAGRVLKSSRASRARLDRVGAHVLAGFRLRRALAQADAVLAPDGQLLHAEHEAREPRHQQALRDAVKAFDRARSRERRIDPDTALEAWRALVSGRWSLVETFESDGRRYLVARRNPPGAMPGQALGRLEAHALVLRAQGASYKLAAYELDISAATAHRLVRAGMRKLGVSHESELPLLIQACAKLPTEVMAESKNGQ